MLYVDQDIAGNPGLERQGFLSDAEFGSQRADSEADVYASLRPRSSPLGIGVSGARGHLYH
ncbi:hypothetical protein ABW16_10085 [Mycolicibacter heraklionensis]|uniref:Uncharacterized protein n=1 Tax=Mycolicibacter heraklionensis TaxID=512402 RepID=A0ABR5FGD6_9MYCO|nr:hypothetical protein ABW16_10085 [Mycolicibacter heraklionensis]